MAKFQSPLLGYNNNVRHKNRVFHIQTEDSGVNHPHVITHLFMDGGRILKSVKKSYAEHVGTDGMNELVKLMMKEQHKAMFIALRDGQFDQLVGGGEAGASKPPAAGSVAPPAAAVVVPVAPVVAVVASPKIEDKIVDPTKIDTAPEIPASQKPDSAPMTTREEQPPAVSIDYEAVERAGENDVGGPLFEANDLPPPPKHLFAREPGTGGAYRAVDSDPPPPRSARQPVVETKPGSKPPGEGRYAPARPAAIFGTSPSVRPSPSIFSDELISDKSLDEVILSYLAEDLEPPRRK